MSSATSINPYGTKSVNGDEMQYHGGTATTSKRLESAAITGRKSLTATALHQNSDKQLESGTGLIASVPSSQQQQLQNILKPQDTLEYIIKFPTPQFRSASSTTMDQPDTDDFVFVYNDTHVPIVMLLGWAGCQDRYLMKYSKIYEDRG